MTIVNILQSRSEWNNLEYLPKQKEALVLEAKKALCDLVDNYNLLNLKDSDAYHLSECHKYTKVKKSFLNKFFDDGSEGINNNYNTFQDIIYLTKKGIKEIYHVKDKQTKKVCAIERIIPQEDFENIVQKYFISPKKTHTFIQKLK